MNIDSPGGDLRDLPFATDLRLLTQFLLDDFRGLGTLALRGSNLDAVINHKALFGARRGMRSFLGCHKGSIAQNHEQWNAKSAAPFQKYSDKSSHYKDCGVLLPRQDSFRGSKPRVSMAASHVGTEPNLLLVCSVLWRRVFCGCAMNPRPKVPTCKKILQPCIARVMQLGKQQGGKVARTRRSRGAAHEFHLFRILTVARARFSRIARTEHEIVPQLARDISLPATRENILL